MRLSGLRHLRDPDSAGRELAIEDGGEEGTSLLRVPFERAARGAGAST
jgi:hypothetical protein